MKKYIFIFLIVVTSGIISSCNKKLDLPSDGRITLDEVFADYNGARAYLNSCYGFCPTPGMDRSSFSDEAQDADDIVAGSNFSVMYSGALSASTFSTYSVDGSPWGTLYQGVRKCNVFIDRMESSSIYMPDVEKAGMLAQARTLRALYYLQLIKRYGGVPLYDKPIEIGYDFSNDKRATFAEVVEFIIEDCDAALAVEDDPDGFHWSINNYNQYGLMSRAIAYAIKSEAVTYAASPLWSDGTFTWADATEINAEALSQCLANDYKLFDNIPASDIAQNAYALYFFTYSNDLRAIDKETIYHCGTQMQVWRDAGLPTNPSMAKAGPCPTQDLVDSYEMANGEAPIIGYSDAERLVPVINDASGYSEADPYTGRDPRFYASIYYNDAVRYLDQPDGKKVETFVGGTEGISSVDRKYTRTGYYLRKFNNNKSGLNNMADGAVRLLRLAELYLNFAESAYQSHGPDVPVTIGSFSMSARDAVNAVRARAGMPPFPAGMSKADFEKKYRNERRIELAFEGHRYFDVRRWNIMSDTDKFVTGMRITKNGEDLTYSRFKFTDRNCYQSKYLLYPIDPVEVTKMLALTGVDWQNPGWLD